MANYGPPLDQRYVVNAETGCWEWIAANTGAKRGKAYGCVNRAGERKAHRLFYRMHRGEIPPGQQVLHSCDNPPCVNPDHLFLGTQPENMTDMRVKGRGRGAPGSANPSAKLNEATVAQIKARLARGESCAALGREFGVAETMIGFIKRGVAWRHVA